MILVNTLLKTDEKEYFLPKFVFNKRLLVFSSMSAVKSRAYYFFSVNLMQEASVQRGTEKII